jgi:hypothetical protein
MKNLFWRVFAKVLAHPVIANRLINRAQRTPYLHIMSADGTEMYMGRWWLFNPYDNETRERRFKWSPWSIRIHHIKRADGDRDLHDHPWNARTIILRGNYTEQRLLEQSDPVLAGMHVPEGALATEYITRNPGDTAQLSFGEYHRIDEVSEGGVYTLFISGPYQGVWGFLVNGAKVDWRTYTGEE